MKQAILKSINSLRQRVIATTPEVTNLITSGLTATTIDSSSINTDSLSATTISGDTIYGDGSNLTGIDNDFTTASTLNGTILSFDRTDTLSAYTVDLSSLATDIDTFITGFTYDSTVNQLTITEN